MIRSVNNDIDRDLRIVLRRVTHEGNNILAIASGEGFGCACFAADHVAGRARRVSRAVLSRDNGKRRFPNLRARCFRYGLLQQAGLNIPDRSAGRACNFFDDMRFIIVTAVDQ